MRRMFTLKRLSMKRVELKRIFLPALMIFGVAFVPVSDLINGDFEHGPSRPPYGWTEQGETIVITDDLDSMTNNALRTVAQGKYAARLADEVPWHRTGVQSSSLEQTVVVPANSAQGTYLQFAYAVVANDPPDHPNLDKPGFRVVVEDLTTSRILTDTQFVYTSQTSGSWYLGAGANVGVISQPFYYAHGDRWVFRPWTEVRIPLINLDGHRLRVRFEVRDCNYGAHASYGYLDAVRIGQPANLSLPQLEGNPLPAIFVDPPFWAPLLLQIETWGLTWLCFWLPLLLLLGLSLWLLLRRKPRKRTYVPAPPAPPRKREPEQQEEAGGGFMPGGEDTKRTSRRG